MSQALERRALDLFEAWLDIPEDARAAWMEAQTAHDPELKAALAQLIAAHAHATMIPTEPPEPGQFPESTPPERVGVYRIVAPIGRGGMGMVYRAERDDGLFAQTVAIKIIRPGIFSPRAAQQFARERQILAGLQHPNIARLYDGGTSPDGLSYFVMELIDGAPITRHCEERKLDLRARVALVAQLCEAVQFAHQKLVVHADIKPGNVLVEPAHGPKLLDFGISRLSDDSDGGDGQGSGLSPAFASPQQRAGASATPADDIYALGRMLEELTVGMSLDRELAAVIARARADEPQDRYATAGALGEDLQRWRRGEPVRALPDSRWRDVTMFVGRHRIATALASFMVLALAGAAVVSTTLYLRAEARFNETREMSRFLLDDVVDGLQPIPGSGELRRRIANRAHASLERLSRVPGASEELEAETADALARVGQILTASELRDVGGSGSLGEKSLERADAMLTALTVRAPERADWRLVLAETRVTRARYLTVDTSADARAEALLDQANALLAAPDVVAVAPFAAALARLDSDIARADVFFNASAYDRMIAIMEQALARAETIKAGAPRERADLALRLDRMWAHVGDARWYGFDDKKAALAAYEKQLAALTAAGADGDVRIVRRKAHASFNLGSTLFELGRRDEALDTMAQAMEHARRMRLFDDSMSARHQMEIVRGEYVLELQAVGRIAEAKRMAQQALAARRENAALAPESYQVLRSLPIALRAFGELYRDNGEPAEACRMFREAHALWRDAERRGMLTDFDRKGDLAMIENRVARCPPDQKGG